LQSKNTYTVAQAKFRGTEQLYQHDIVDRESYESEKNTLQTDLLGYMNQEQSLRDFMQNLPAPDRFDLQQLTLQDTAKVKAILQRPVAITEMVAPMAGVALLADKDKDGAAIAIGASIKKDTSLLLVGDLSGLLLHFKVPENQIRSIKVGDKVEVTAQALPSVKFQGQIQQISAQATLDGNQSVFPATVVVPSLPADIISKVRVGMTAQVVMHVVQPKGIYVPIKAVAIRDGHKQVAVLEHGKQHWVDVGTAATSDDLVEISHGLAVGQKVLVPS
jgi:HlyD family secretion protein